MKTKQKILVAAVLGLALGLVNLVCAWTLLQARGQAGRTIADADLCNQLAKQIVELQAKPAVATTGEQANQELTARIESAARALGITGDNLASIAPAPAARVSGTAYLEKPTTVELRQVTLGQLVSLLCNLSGDGQVLRIRSLRLTTPPQKQAGDLWSAEMTITYLIYAPQTPSQLKGEL